LKRHTNETGIPLSLGARVLLLFLGFSVLPVLFLGAGDYVQSMAALGAVIEARSDALAEQTGREVEAVHTRASAALLAAGRLAVLDGPVGPFSSVTLVDGETAAVPVTGCQEARTIPVRAELPPGPGLLAGRTVEGALPVETVLYWAPSLRTRMGKGGYAQLLDRQSGRLLFDARCESATTGVAQTLAAAPSVSSAVIALGNPLGWHVSLRHHDDDGADVFVAIATAGPAWGVAVHVSDQEFVAPFRRARTMYLGLGLLVMSLGAGAFVLLARNAFRSLRSVTAAADRIELGDMRPWLPPPGNDEVGRLSLAFHRMTERLEESVRRAELNQKLAAVGELATYLSHEIRNPLSSIRLSLQSLHRDLASGFIPQDSTRVIEIALNEVKRLDAVVRAVLEMGRPEGPADGRTFPVHQSLDDTLDVLRPKARALGIELVYAPRAERDLVHGDANGLRSVVINLVVNAIDVLEGRRDGRIRVSTWSGDTGELHLRVADNGPGVPEELAASIFEPFFTTKTRGNGIGLPTALRTVQPWGGTIIHEPVAAGSGAVFVVKLKLADPPVAAVAPEETLTTAIS
jgi:signal transduction histidine kinase